MTHNLVMIIPKWFKEIIIIIFIKQNGYIKSIQNKYR